MSTVKSQYSHTRVSVELIDANTYQDGPSTAEARCSEDYTSGRRRETDYRPGELLGLLLSGLVFPPSGKR